jgi:hypothetical protein
VSPPRPSELTHTVSPRLEPCNVTAFFWGIASWHSAGHDSRQELSFETALDIVLIFLSNRFKMMGKQNMKPLSLPLANELDKPLSKYAC